MAHAERHGKSWRGRYIRPDGTRGSTSGYPTKKRALAAAQDEESRIRHNVWVDPRIAETSFEEFAEQWLVSVSPRLAVSTAAKYRSYLDCHLLPQWAKWPMIAIFNSSLEIEKWVGEMHEDSDESSVASRFALFSTIVNTAVRARVIPANPCAGIKVTSGLEVERLVATSVQGLRAAMRLYESLGLGGFVLCLVDLYTGGRWGELAGQERHEYESERRAVHIRQPLKEVGGKLTKSGKDVARVIPAPKHGDGKRRRVKRGTGTKTPAGTRVVPLPPSIATLYELLLDSHSHSFVFVTPEGHPWHRSNFRIRFWRPAWDGTEVDAPDVDDPVPAILPYFTFNEGRHTHSTWLADDGIPEVARRARLGQKMKGIARVYDHVTPEMESRLLDALERRWVESVQALDAKERDKLATWLPHLKPLVDSCRAPLNRDGHGE